MTSLGERLLVLNDTKDGLLARTYYFLGFKKPATFDDELEKICSKIKKKYPEIPEGMDKLPGYSSFRDRSLEVCAALEEYFNHIVNLNNFSNLALALLTDISTRILEFQYDIHQDIMSKFFDLFVGYCQVLLLAAKLPEPQEYTIVYAYAYQLSKSYQHPEWMNITGFVENLDKPLNKIRQECEPLSFHMGNSLRSLQELYTTYSNFDFLRDHSIFNLLENPASLGLVEESPMYRNMLNVNKMKDWILYGFLMCPQELQAENARELLKVALKDGWNLTVYREHFYKSHEQFHNLFDTYKNKKFKLSKHKDVLKASTTPEAIQDAVETHKKLRNLLRAEIRGLLSLLKDFPGVLGPKAEVVLAALNMAKEEINWYFQHIVEHLNGKSGMKAKSETWKDYNISELFYLIDQLVALLRKHADFVRDFSIEYMKNKLGEAKMMVNEIIDSSAATMHVKDMLEKFIKDIEVAKNDSSFSQFRDNVTVLTTTLSEAQTGLTSRFSKQLMQLMSTLSYYSRNADDLEGQIKNYGSTHYMWSCLDDFLVLFKECLGSPYLCRHTIALVRSFDYMKNVLHKFCPEEQLFLSEKVTGLAEKALLDISAQVEELCKLIYLKEIVLMRQVVPQEASARLQLQMSGKEAELSPLPGYESQYINKSVLSALRLPRKALMELCTAIRETPSIKVYATVFAAQEYVFDICVESLRKQVRKVLRSEKRGFERPSIIAAKLTCVLNSYDIINNYLNIEIPQIIKFVLFGETFDETAGTVGNLVLSLGDEKEEKVEEKTVIRDISEFYTSLLDFDLSQYGVLYSEISKGFVNIPVELKKGVEIPDFLQNVINYAHLPELKSLCQTVGPYGVRFIERQLLSSIFKHLRFIKETLDANKTILPALAPRLSQTSIWNEGFRKLKNVDDLMSHGLKIGVILQFRKLLFQAHSEVMQERVPFLFETTKELRHRLLDFSQSPDLRPFWALSRDLGIGDVTSDVNLLQVLRQFKGSRTDDELWKLLPEQFSFILLCKEWKNASYNVSIDAFTNNGHCLVETIIALIVGFTSILVEEQIENPPPASELQQNIRKQMVKFIRYASYTLLHMQQQNSAAPDTYKDYNLDAMQLFLQKFIEDQNYVKMSDLEESFPFTIIRNTNIQLSEQQTDYGRVFARTGAEMEAETKEDDA